MRRKMKPITMGVKRKWAWKLSFEFRFALFLTHATPRHSPERIEMAECLRKALRRGS